MVCETVVKMNAGDPSISVIIPTYNRAGVLSQAIDSVLAQTYRPVEIIVVDDGSTDGTREALKRYGETIKYIYRDNGGVSAARNTGIRAAVGDWVALLDSDDEWMPEKLEVQTAALKKHPGLVSHVTNCIFVLGDGSDVSLFDVRGCPSLGADGRAIERPLRFALGQMFHTSTYLVRRRVLIDAGLFDERFSMYEDLDCFARVALHGPAGISNQAMAKVFNRGVGEANLSLQTVELPAKTLGNLIIMCENLPNRKLAREDSRFLARFLGGSRFRLGLAQRADGDWREARRSFLRSFGDDPCPRTALKVFLAVGLCGYGLRAVERWGGRQGKGFRREDWMVLGKMM